MKAAKWYTLQILFLFVLLLSHCKKNKTDEPQLPPETTTGENTFGCKINGKVFVPKDGRGKPGLFVQYINLGNGPGGGWFLNIPATNWKPTMPEGISIETDSLLVIEGNSYFFKNKKGFPRAFYDNQISFIVLDNNGKLIITKFDISKRILSGKFSFIATNTTNGDQLNITEGRFDVRY